jgi:hypothetical protein
LNAFIAEGIREAEKGKPRATGGRKANGTRHGVGRATANTQYKICNKGNTKCTGGSTNDNTPLVQSSYSGSSSQQWSFQSLSNQLGTYEVSPASKTASTIWPASGSTNDGAAVQAITYSSPDTQKWHITPL